MKTGYHKRLVPILIYLLQTSIVLKKNIRTVPRRFVVLAPSSYYVFRVLWTTKNDLAVGEHPKQSYVEPSRSTQTEMQNLQRLAGYVAHTAARIVQEI